MPPENALTRIRDYFEMSTADFSKQWKTLTPEAKQQLKSGILDGTETY
jgi:hypothetical protein